MILIPRIEYVSYNTGTVNSVPVITIMLRNNSNSINPNATWSLSVNSGSAVSSNTSGEYFALTMHNTDFRVTVTLTNGTVYARCTIISTSGDITFYGSTLTVTVLPVNQVFFDIGPNRVDIVGSNAAQHYSYQVSFNDDLVIDSSSFVPVVFTNTYSSNSLARLNFTVLEGMIALLMESTVDLNFDELYDDASDLNVVNNDCETLTVWSDTKNYIAKLIGRGDLDNSAMKSLVVNIKQNCCQEIEYKLSPLYKFALDFGPCSYDEEPEPVEINGEDYYPMLVELQLNGIIPSIVSTMQVIVGNDTYNVSNTNVVDIVLYTPVSNPTPPINPEVTITLTTVEGFVYTITGQITVAGLCDAEIVLTDITYPDYPCHTAVDVTETNTSLIITPEVFYGCDTEELFEDGVYQVTLNDSNISNEYVTKCLYLNCDTYCAVIAAIGQGCDPTILIIYNALISDCNLDCESMCRLLEYLNAKMSECDCALYYNNLIPEKKCKNCVKSQYKPCKTCK